MKLKSIKLFLPVIFCTAFLTVSLFPLPAGHAQASAASDPGIVVDGQALDLPAGPVNRSGHILAPMNAFFEALQATVYWDGTSRAIRAFTPAGVVTLVIGQATASFSGQTVTLDAVPELIDGMVYVPVRSIAEALGGRAEWDSERRLIVMTSQPQEPVEEPDGADPSGDGQDISMTPEEYDLFLRVVNAEAFGEPREGKVAVAAVILNRVRHPSFFPDTVMEVLTQPNQFYVVQNGAVNRELEANTKEAADAALAGEDPSLGALFFFDPRFTTDPYMLGREVTVVIGHHRFAK